MATLLESGEISPSTKIESALRKQGVDEELIARRLKGMLFAKGKRWNSKTESWEVFEDHKTQLRATEELAKILGCYPTQKELEDRRPRATEVIVKVEHERPSIHPSNSTARSDNPYPSQEPQRSEHLHDQT